MRQDRVEQKRRVRVGNCGVHGLVVGCEERRAEYWCVMGGEYGTLANLGKTGDRRVPVSAACALCAVTRAERLPLILR